VELIICYVGTYATSSQVLPAVQKAGAPVLILNLQPASALDYPKTDTGEWLANCCSCCVPEIACAFARSRIDFHVVTGVLGVEGGRHREAPPNHPDSQRAWREIMDWVRAASVVSRLKRSRIGFLGQTYPGMLDMYSDFTQHTVSHNISQATPNPDGSYSFVVSVQDPGGPFRVVVVANANGGTYEGGRTGNNATASFAPRW